MDKTQSKLNHHLSIDDWIAVYSKAMVGLYKRMLRYANQPFAESGKADGYYGAMARTIYGDDYHTDVGELVATMADKRSVLTVIEGDYKRIATSYKKRYAQVLGDYFEHELDGQAENYNNFADPADVAVFNGLVAEHGAGVAALVTKEALGGNLWAKTLMGKISFLGWGVPIDQEKGLDWFKQAADGDFGEALYYAGKASDFITYTDAGVPLNSDSLGFYYAAFDKGWGPAAYALYKHYSYYLAGKTGSFKAKKWLDIGLKNRIPYCLYEVEEGFPGEFMTNNMKNIGDWLLAAAQLNAPGAKELYLKYFDFHEAVPDNG